MTKEVEVKDVMEAFEAFKDTNDKRIKEIESEGRCRSRHRSQAGEDRSFILLAHEDANQKITVAAAAQVKKAEEDIKSLKETLERIEAKAGRPGAGKADEGAGRSQGAGH
jgi:hypothetical protein